MSTKTRFVKYYNEGFMPWAHRKPDFNLVEMVKSWPVKACKTLEIGCGTGTDAIWLAKQGFEVTGIDAVEIPINLAIEQAKKEKINCTFLVKDFLKDEIPGGPYQFVFDRGFFHSFKSRNSRKKFAENVFNQLTNEGIWVTLAGSCDSPPREEGPPMISARNIIDAVEPLFEIKLLKSSVFGSESEVPANIWVCLMKKR